VILGALIAVAAFLLGLRLGLALGHKNERRRIARLEKRRQEEALARSSA
jgi:hypothetical protein